MTTRFTIHDLRNIVELCNQRLERHGCKVRINERSRYDPRRQRFTLFVTAECVTESSFIASVCSCIGSGVVARAVARETLAWTRRRIDLQQKLDGASRRTQYHAAADRKPPITQSIDVSKHKSHRTQYHASYDGRDVTATVMLMWPAWVSDAVGLGRRARY